MQINLEYFIDLLQSQMTINIVVILVLFGIFFALKKLTIKYILVFLNTYIKDYRNIKKKHLNSSISAILFAVSLFYIHLSIAILGISNDLADKTLYTLSIISIIYILISLVGLFSSHIERICSKIFLNLYKEIATLAIKIIKIIIVFTGFISILSSWGINISAFLASLGIGGLALALAAKDTIANFFGGIALLADDSLKVGDWVKIRDIEGIVEDIGLRATKIRTFSKSLINVPNQIVANDAVENFSRRGIRRISFSIGLVYSTSPQQMQNILQDIKEMVNAHDKISQESIKLINFDAFSDSALMIKVYIFANTAVWSEYLNIREDVNLKIMQIVQKNNSTFAFPSTSLYVENDIKLKTKN